MIGARASAPARRARRSPSAFVFAAVLAGIGAAALAILVQSAPRRAGTNMTSDLGYVLHLAPRQTLCEPGEIIPAGTGALRLRGKPQGGRGPALSSTVTGPAGQVTNGSRGGGWQPGLVSIPLRRVVQDTVTATVCLTDIGPVGASFGGSVPDGSFIVDIDGHPLAGRLRIDYMRPGRESWLSLLPELQRRVAIGKGDLVRHWAFYGFLVLMLAAVALAGRALLAGERSTPAEGGPAR
jgi:hypothetical protein